MGNFLIRFLIGLLLVLVLVVDALVLWADLEPISTFIKWLLIGNMALVGMCWLALRQCHKEKEFLENTPWINRP